MQFLLNLMTLFREESGCEALSSRDARMRELTQYLEAAARGRSTSPT